MKIKTSGDLRAYLCDAIIKVESGAMDVQTAKEITKIASQVNESLYAEVKVSKLKLEMGEKAQRFGNLDLSK